MLSLLKLPINYPYKINSGPGDLSNYLSLILYFHLLLEGQYCTCILCTYAKNVTYNGYLNIDRHNHVFICTDKYSFILLYQFTSLLKFSNCCIYLQDNNKICTYVYTSSKHDILLFLLSLIVVLPWSLVSYILV